MLTGTKDIGSGCIVISFGYQDCGAWPVPASTRSIAAARPGSIPSNEKPRGRTIAYQYLIESWNPRG